MDETFTRQELDLIATALRSYCLECNIAELDAFDDVLAKINGES